MQTNQEVSKKGQNPVKTAVASETETPRKITQGSKTNKTRYLMWWETRGKWRHCLAKDLVSTAYATISEGSSYFH